LGIREVHEDNLVIATGRMGKDKERVADSVRELGNPVEFGVAAELNRHTHKDLRGTKVGAERPVLTWSQ
jgi:hypothetical protein